METTQKGSMVYIVIAVIAVLAAIGAFTYYSNNKTSDTSTAASSTVDTQTATSAATTSTSAASAGPTISWSYVKNGNVSDVILTINGKQYKTGVSAAGCGTTVAKANLATGQLAATQCAIKGASGTEVAVYREDKGYKVTSTEIFELSDGQSTYYKRGAVTTILNIK